MESELLMVTTRLLPDAEWYKLETIEPYRSEGLPDPAHWLIPVVELDGQIVASCAIFDTVHWDIFHVTETQRHNPAVIKALILQALHALQESGASAAHLTIAHDRPDLMAMAERFGFVRSPHQLYIVRVPPPQEL